MNKVIWGVLGALIIVIGVYFLSRNNQVAVPTAITVTKTPEDTSTNESKVVTYSDSGFSPASITVKAGDTVTFKNLSSKSMWVASAPHPTHTAYPEFDAKKGSVMGENYMFTFTKAGTWKYHDHLNPTSFGTIVVE